MIAKYWGMKVNYNFLSQSSNLTSQGMSLKDLALLAESLKFNTRPVKASLGGIEKNTNPLNPWIAHWQGNHFVVVYQTNPNSVLIADPAVGKQLISRHKFQDMWTGYALIMEPTD
jgi:ABC-type bacteriocin/lantibiotic exporter with double-glycine peptidase domain